MADPGENGTAAGSVSRRRFMTAASGTVAATAASPLAARSLGANDRLRVGLIGAGRRSYGSLVPALLKVRERGTNLDIVAVNDVYSVHRDRAKHRIGEATGVSPTIYGDYREMLAKEKLDAVCIGTPDHWHARQTIDALGAGVHVYCEKPMTHTIDEAAEVVRRARESGLVVQIGTQSTSSPIWDEARGLIVAGKLGKVVQFQTEYFRNSRGGMTRHNEITPEMTPDTIDWPQWLGVNEGLAPAMPFDREVYAQWRCYWPFSCGMYGDLFVHRVTCMLKATGLRQPGRVVAGGGIFLEYDNRDVPDVASIIADFHEGVQGFVSSTMVSCEVKLDHVIRGHHGSILFSSSCFGSGPQAAFEFVPERAEVTGDRSLKRKTHRAEAEHPVEVAHMANFVSAVRAGDPAAVNCPPELGAAAVTLVNLGVRSYREGKVFHIDSEGVVGEGDASWARLWEQMSERRDKPRHVAGWLGGDAGSLLYPPEYQKLAGPWDAKGPHAP